MKRTTTPFSLGASLLAALASLSTLPTPAAAGPIGTSGTRVGALAGYGSTLFSGGERAPEAEISRSDDRGNGAHASAVLRDGALHATAVSHADQPPGCRDWTPTCASSNASAHAEMWDILTFTRSELADPSQVRWRFEISGTENVGSLFGGTARGSFAHYVGTGAGWGMAPLYDVNQGDVIRGSFQMASSTLTVYLYAGLEARATNGGIADYGNTARFQLDLPQGVTFTSRSRVFMADRPPLPAVPETSTWAMTMAGLAMLGWLFQRRVARGELGTAR